MLLLSFGAVFTSCGIKYESEINVCNWGEYISDGTEDSLDVIKEFEKKYKIKVNYSTFDENEKLYSIMKSGSVKYDVIVPSDYMVEKLINENMLLKIDFNNIQNYKNISEDFKNLSYDPTNEYSVPNFWGTIGIIYNKTKVEETPTSWGILWDEKYSGQIIMPNNSRDSFAIALKRLGIDTNTHNSEDLKKAYDELMKQKPLVQDYLMDKIFGKMENNDAALGVYYAGDCMSMMENNPDLGFVLPQEGTNKFVDALCIPKGAQNKTGAEKFIDFMLDPEISLANTEYVQYSTPNTETFKLLDSEVKENQLIYPSDDYLEKCYEFRNPPAEIYAEMEDLWMKVRK